MRRTLEQRFEAKVDRSDGEDACHLWTGAKNGRGYGNVGFEGTTVGAHRLAMFIATGVWPVETLHMCDNPPCVNVRHLRDDSHAANMADAVSKGRMGRDKKLTPAMRKAIRDLAATEYWTIAKLARLFNVSYTTAHGIVNGSHGYK